MAIKDTALNIVIRAKDLTGQALARLRRNIDDTDRSARQAGTGIARMAKAIGGMIAAATGITTLTAAFRGILRTGDDFEKLGVTMTALMGSVQQGEQATAWIKTFAKDTPLQVSEVTEAFIAMRGFGLDPMDGSLQAVVDQAAKLGKGFEGVKGISLALGQAWAKQKLQGEEILQLVERGIPVWDLLADVTGRTTAELQELSSAGALGRDVIADLIEAMGRGSTGAAAANMSLLSGYISNLKDEWAGFQNEVAQAGALEFAKDTLADLLATVQRMKADGSLQALAKSWANGFTTVGNAIIGATKGIASVSTELRLLAQAWIAVKIASWVGVLGRAAAGFGLVAAGATRATAAIKLMGGALRLTLVGAAAEILVRIASGINDVRLAAEANEKSQARLATAYERANQVSVERARNLGLEIQSLRQWKEAIRDGAITLDAQTGAYTLNREAAEAQGYALTATAAAMDTAKQAAQALQAPFRALQATFADARAEGDTLNEALEKIGLQAIAGGVPGIEALALTLRQLEYQGEATRTELIDGLGDALTQLNDEQRATFAENLTQALREATAAGSDTVTNLSQIQTLLEANLVAAARAAGVSISAALTGIDDETDRATTALKGMVDAMNAAGREGEDASKIMAAGFEKVIDTLDTPEELDAFTAELQRMAAEGEIGTDVLNAGLNKVLAKTAELEAQASATGEALAGAMDEAGDAAEGAAQVGNEAAGIGAAMAGIYEGVHAEIEKLSDKSVEAFENLQAMNGFKTDEPVSEMQAFTQSIEDSAASIARMAGVAIGDFVGVSTWMKNLRINAEQTKIAFYEQKKEFTRLMDEWENGAITADAFAQRAEAAQRSMNLLDQQDLDHLQAAIEQAEATMERLKETTEDTLTALRNELDQLQGNTVDVEKRQYEARKRDLEEALADAEKSQSDEAIGAAREALRVAQDIHRTKLDQIAERARAEKQAEQEQLAREQERAKAAAEREARTKDSTTTPTPPTPAGAAATTTIELKLNGKTSQVTTDNPDALIDLLTQAGLRTQ